MGYVRCLKCRGLLPIDDDNQAGLNSGFTPLLKANRLAEELWARTLFIKDDSAIHPSLSFKDRDEASMVPAIAGG